MSFKRPLLALGILSLMNFSAEASKQNVECILRGSCIEAQSVTEHLEELQKIAESNNGNRSAGTSGHVLSANYVAQQLLAAGYKVELQPFSFMKFTKISASLSQYEETKDFVVMNYSGSGNISAELTPVDLALGQGNQSTSGCEAEDFADFKPGTIALIQRGTCAFQDKVENAQAAGAAGVIMFNQGNSSDREEIFSGTLSEGSDVKIPVFATSYPFALSLLEQEGLVLSMSAETEIEKKSKF